MFKNRIIEQIIRVDHAGEYGALNIYKGQLKILQNDVDIQHMYEQEAEHLKYFDQQISENQIRPTLLMPIYRVMAISLGMTTALMGRKIAMACTIAVEEVIDEHYQEQISTLDKFGWEPKLSEQIKIFRKEELEHRDKGIEQEGEEAVGYKMLSKFIKIGCKAAIFASKHV